MRTIIWIAHISLDGYVANQAGQLDDFESGEDNLSFVAEICNEADTILSGRVTYEMLDAFWPEAGSQPGATAAEKKYSNWYNSTARIVASRSKTSFGGTNVSVVNGDLLQYIRQVKKQKGKAIVVFGSSNLADQLIADDLVDVYWIFLNPVIFGGGVPLFKSVNNVSKLKLEEIKRFANGETALKYLAKK